ncbi:MAG TPA: sugar ABC transporter ATP-binding protein [bacterium]|nr:sugar ABC transporter ATP-binding protein [bacterium]
MESVLEMTHISKSFPGVQALEDVSLSLAAGEVLAIVGENGAGKSTLIKILSGVYAADRGEVKLRGEQVLLKGPKDAMDHGVNTIYQETSLVQDISVAENLFLGRQPLARGRRVDWKSMKAAAGKVLDELSIRLAPDAIVASLSSAQQQLVEIAKAFSRDARIIIMDEPTASITAEDTENLFAIIRRITASGTAVLYISHRLKEIFQIASRVMILRDGRTVTEAAVQDLTEADIVRNMVGRDIGNLYGETSYEARPTVVLDVKGLAREGVYRDISFQLHEGEILGFSGLVGAGRSEIMRGIFGLDPVDHGEVLLGGRRLEHGAPAAALRRGVAFVSEDRRLESIIQGFTVRANITILLLVRALGRLGLISSRKENGLAARYVREFNVKTSSLDQLVMNLSGGNQQKVALAKCLSTEPRVLILDEPTKGIDVGAKKEIHTLIKELARRGVAVLLVSSELPEIIGMCHRVAVIREGAMAGVFGKQDLTEERLIAAAVGHTGGAAGHAAAGEDVNG